MTLYRELEDKIPNNIRNLVDGQKLYPVSAIAYLGLILYDNFSGGKLMKKIIRSNAVLTNAHH